MADLRSTLHIANHGMMAQTERMKIISQNVANATTTALTPEEEPYRRQRVFFKNSLDRELGVPVVTASRIDEDPSPLPSKFEPTHPAANAQGYIQMPNVSPIIEKVDLQEAQRTYEANLSVVETTRSMVQQTIDLLR